MSPARILAIVLNWRQPAVTLACAAALQTMHPPAVDILLVDNGSSDNSIDMFKQQASTLELLALPQNVGFAAGNNAGLKRALDRGYDYALLINNDAFAAPDMLENLVAESAPDIGLLTPKIYYESEPKRIWYGNGRQHPATLDLRDTGRGQMDGPAFQTSHDVDYVLGTCLLVNLAAVRRVGLLDESYFMYFEDLDWSLRMRQSGFRLRLAADAHLYHRVAVSSGGRQDSPLRRYHLARSSVIFWRRHFRSGNPLAIVGLRVGSGVKMVGRLLLQGELETAVAYLRGLRDGWRMASNG